MKNHLKKNRVIDTDNSEVKIEVKRGKAICILKTTYFDYSNHIENVNFAMKNYHYKINII